MELKKQNFIQLINNNRGIIRSLCKVYYGSYEDQKDAFQDIVLQLWKSFYTFRGDAKHPSQLYEAISYLIWKSRKFYENSGLIFGLGIVLIFTLRFLIEFLKESQVVFEQNLILNMGQTLSIPLVLVGIFVLRWSLTQQKRTLTK